MKNEGIAKRSLNLFIGIVYIDAMLMRPRKVRPLLSIASLAVVFAVLLASWGVPVSTHWCHGQAMDVRLFAHASSCMAETTPKAAGVERMGCCDDQQEFLKAEGLENDGPRIAVEARGLFQNLVWVIAWVSPQLSQDTTPKMAFDVPTHRERSSGRAVYALSESWLI